MWAGSVLCKVDHRASATRKQQTLSGFDNCGKTTRREQFLAVMEQIIPWPELAAAVQTVYPKTSEKGGHDRRGDRDRRPILRSISCAVRRRRPGRARLSVACLCRTLNWARRPVFLACVFFAVPVQLEADDVPAEPMATTAETVAVEYSILTPALESEYVVYAAWDALIDLVTSHVNTAYSRQLRAAVKTDGFDAKDRLAIELQNALVAAGYPTNIEFVRRAPDGKVRGLSRGDLPEDPKGRYLVNLTVNGIGLGASSSLSSYHPYLSLTWQLYTRDGQRVGFLHKYQQLPGSYEQNLAPVDCELPRFNDLMQQPAPLWACYDRAFRAAALALVPEILAATPRVESDAGRPGRP